MKCLKCNKETFIDRQDKDGRLWRVCMNAQCEEYQKSFTLSGQKSTESKMEKVPSKTETVE